MPNRSKQKGDRHEREVKEAFLAKGIHAERVPYSGALGGKYSGDIQIKLGSEELKIECKHHKDGFKTVYKYLSNNYALISRANHKPNLITLRLDHFLDMAERVG